MTLIADDFFFCPSFIVVIRRIKNKLRLLEKGSIIWLVARLNVRQICGGLKHFVSLSFFIPQELQLPT